MYVFKNYQEIPTYINEMQDYILKTYSKGNKLSNEQILIGDKIIENWKLNITNQNSLIECFYKTNALDIEINLINTNPTYMNVSAYINTLTYHKNNKTISIEDILKGLGYADSTIKTTIKKFSNKSLSNEEDVINILTQVAKSTSKFKKPAKEYLKNIFGIEVI